MAVKNEYENGFIYGFEIDEKMCDDLINWFEETEIGEHHSQIPTDAILKVRGRDRYDTHGTREGKENVLKKLKSLHKRGEITKDELHRRAGKQSTDLSFGAFNSHPALRNYLDKGLDSVIRKYGEKFPYAFDGPLGFVAPACMPDSDDRRKTGNGDFQWKTGTTINIQKYEPGEGFFSWHSERTVPNAVTVDRALVFMTYLNDVPHGGTKFFHQDITTPAKKGLTLIWPVDWTHLHAGQVTEESEKYIITGWIHYIRGCDPEMSQIPYFADIPSRN